MTTVVFGQVCSVEIARPMAALTLTVGTLHFVMVAKAALVNGNTNCALLVARLPGQHVAMLSSWALEMLVC